MIYITTQLSIQPKPEELNNTRIGHTSIARLNTDAAVITASTEATGFPAKAASNGLTYSYWQPTVLPASWQLGTGDKAVEQFIDYLGIASHTLGSTGATVEWQTKIGAGAWTTRHSFTPTDDSPIMVLDTLDTNADATNGIMHRINIPSQTGSVLPKVGVIYMGKTLKMQRRIYAGHKPETLTPITKSLPVRSETGQFIGHSITRNGMAGSWKWQNLDRDWYRANFVPFIEDFASYPAFIGWRPYTFGDEVAYIWRAGGALPIGVNQGQHRMSVTLKAEGHGGNMGTPVVESC